MDQPSLKLNSSRRRLLKLIAAAGGGVAASAFLPARWLKPVVRSGVLPAHAQTSQLFAITSSAETFENGSLCTECTISPAASGVALKMVATVVREVAGSGPLKSTSLPLAPVQGTTGANGLVDFGCQTLTDPQDVLYIDCVYSFVNSWQCTPAGCTWTKRITNNPV